jgi:hypothetical protein
MRAHPFQEISKPGILEISVCNMFLMKDVFCSDRDEEDMDFLIVLFLTKLKWQESHASMKITGGNQRFRLNCTLEIAKHRMKLKLLIFMQ